MNQSMELVKSALRQESASQETAAYLRDVAVGRCAPRIGWGALAAMAASVIAAVLLVGRTIAPVVETPPVNASDFYPMRNGPMLLPGEAAQMIQVRVPRTALTIYGLPGGIYSGEETIGAQVLVGQDGVARAIRFVK